MHRLFTIGNNSSNPKQFDTKMKAYLEKQGSHYSKYKAKCRRVSQIAEILNSQTAVLLAYNISIATLENANKKDSNANIEQIKDSEELKAFSSTIEFDENGLLPKLIQCWTLLL